MNSLRFTHDDASSDGVRTRHFTLGEVTGVLWSPTSGDDDPALVLMGHGGGLHKLAPDQVNRAHRSVTTWGFTVVAIDAPGHGDRPRSAEDDRVRAELREAMLAGDTAAVASVSVRYGDVLAERAVPEWQATLDALQQLPEIGADAPIGYGGGISLGTRIGIPLVAADPRIRAAIFGAGFVVDDAVREVAARITVPVQFLLSWDDEHVDRQSALALFDAFGSTEKTLHANPGDHRSITWVGLDEEFLARHLGRVPRDCGNVGEDDRVNVRIQCLVVDTTDPARLAGFWESALGWRRTHETADEVVLEPPAGSREDGVAPDLLFVRVPEEKSGKNRLHLDLRPEDQDAEVRRLEQLGARRLDVGQGPDASWVVMADPDGHEFCVLRAL